MPAILHRTNHLRPALELIVYILDDSVQQATLDPALRGIAKGMKWKDDCRHRNDRF